MRSASRPGAPPARRKTFEALAELGLVLLVYLAYRAGRLLTADHQATARANADLVHAFERALPLPSEAAVQGVVGSVRLLEAANWYYLTAHFPITIAFLVWGFFTRPRAEYRWARNLLVVQTLTAVLIHAAFPLAPPRMFPQWHFVDTMTVYGPSAYDGPSAAVANQYAAMPSLHVGWSVLIAVVVWRTGPPLLRRLAALHAVTTFVVVTITANHWFLDGGVAVALLGLALLILPAPGDVGLARCLRRRGRPVPPPPGSGARAGWQRPEPVSPARRDAA
jgi:hypothetical protein